MRAGERRRSYRRRLGCPAVIDTAAATEAYGVTRDLSATGMLLGTPNRLRIGDRATLTIRADTGGDPILTVQGRIVRLQVNERAEHPIWHYLMAVRFHEPLPESMVARMATALACS